MRMSIRELIRSSSDRPSPDPSVSADVFHLQQKNKHKRQTGHEPADGTMHVQEHSHGPTVMEHLVDVHGYYESKLFYQSINVELTVVRRHDT